MMFYNRLLECICPQTKPTRQGRRSWKHVKRLGRWGGGRKSYNVWRASVSRGHEKNGGRRVRKVSNVCRPVMSGFFNRTSCDPSGASFHDYFVVRVDPFTKCCVLSYLCGWCSTGWFVNFSSFRETSAQFFRRKANFSHYAKVGGSNYAVLH